MKIIYYSHTFFSDCDFPLIRELEIKGYEVVCYYHLAPYETNAGLIEIKHQPQKDGIIPASEFVEMQGYSDFVNLKNIYFVNNPHNRKFHYQRYLMWLKLFIHMKKQNADVLHLTYHISGEEKLLYYLGLPIIMTVHDPFLHSGKLDKRKESSRMETFRKSKRLILLNDCQKDDFLKYYGFPAQKIIISRLGEYSHFKYIQADNINFTDKSFILFFGYISPYKGIEYLLESMLRVHDKFSDVDLIIIGRGKIYFDFSKYNNLTYIKLINRFATVKELSELLRKCLFVVCPYTDATQSGVVQTSFSAGVPIVATDVGSFSNVIENGETGIIVPPRDVDSLANAIIDLLANDSKLERLRNNIRSKWQIKMSWHSIANDYINVYNSIIRKDAPVNSNKSD